MIDKKAVVKVFKFVMVGFGCTIIDFGLNFVFLHILHLGVELESIVAHILSFGASTIFGYFANTYWVFPKELDEKQHTIFIKYTLITLFNILWSTIVIWLIVDLFLRLNISNDINVVQMLAKIAIGLPLTVISYFLFEKYIYVK